MSSHMPFQVMPPLTIDEYAALKADIAKRGVLVPVVEDQHGNLLDGHHRRQAAAELGIDCPVQVRKVADDNEAREVALILNVIRRHLGPVSWANAFRQLCEHRGIELGRGARNDHTSATVAEVAHEVGVPTRTARWRLRLADDLARRPDLAEKVDAGELSAGKARGQAVQAERREHVPATVPLPPGRYSTIVADPPWQLRVAGVSKADARDFYDTMPLEKITALPVDRLMADDAHLWLWAINSLIEEAFTVVRAWGFSPLTMVTWCKPGPGVGHYLRNNTEHVILAARGKPMTPPVKPTSTWYQWPRAAHSVKPQEFYNLVREVSPGPRVELFARKPHEGFTPWGNEAGEESQ